MKLLLIKPNYFGGTVVSEGNTIETTEQHGRELIKLGYASEVDDSAAEKAAAEAKEKAEALAKAEEEAKAKASESQEKADAEASAKAAAEAKEKAKK
ncbi:hypothetical protein [Pantoea sp. NGS-ED-1003]|uniref:DUF7210 family protein n=1 Tax=Pantoea sp. NGS-ED-1003 TaxID=1526743 RepID=UPI0005343540|nr:hypothetical protein [Pantoea sp. NGS-ED-1003]